MSLTDIYVVVVYSATLICILQQNGIYSPQNISLVSQSKWYLALK